MLERKSREGFYAKQLYSLRSLFCSPSIKITERRTRILPKLWPRRVYIPTMSKQLSFSSLWSALGMVVLICFLFAGISFTRADEVDDAISKAVAYLKTQEMNPTVTMALVAGGESVDVSYLKSFSGDSAIAYAKPIMALAAAGKNPRTFPNEDFIAKIKSFADGTQLGSPSQINDDIWGTLALISAGVSLEESIIQNSKNFILAHQNSDGGWAWNVDGTSDTNDTAVAIMVLGEVGVTKSDSVIQKAAAYLKGAQNDDGGFPYDLASSFGTPSDSNSNAWIISAINALDEDPKSWTKNGKNPVEHLLSLQDADGGFWWVKPGTSDFNNKGSTADAVIALTGHWYPPRKLSSDIPEVSFRIEGAAAQVCKGKIQAQTAIDVVKKAAAGCGFTYEIQNTSFGPYLTRIGNDKAEGLNGWLYRVNWALPSVGAADYKLSQGDEVLWYYGEFEWQPLRIQLSDSKSAYLPGEKVSGKVEVFFNEKQWNSVSEATVLMNGTDKKTTSDGFFEFFLSQGGVFELRAEKEKSIRSDSISIIVGDVREDVELSVEIVEEQGGGGRPEVGFSVNPSLLAFGQMKPATSATKQVTLKNEGQKDLSVRVLVQGDEVFHFLKIANMIWSAFETLLAASSSKNIDVNLSLPMEFRSFGAKEGKLIFWGMIHE